MPTSEADVIRHQSPREQVEAMVEAQIRRGDLEPGDRLLSINRLTETWSVSRRAIKEGLSALVERGLLQAKPGSGYYVLPRQAPPAATQPPSELIWEHGSYYAPKVEQVQLSLYVADLYPQVLAFWRETLAEIAPELDVDVRLRTGAEGHPRDVMAKQIPDMMVAAADALADAPAGTFTPALPAALAGLSADDVVAPVRHQLQAAGKHACLPFCLSPVMLYCNRDLPDGPGSQSLSSVEALLAWSGDYYRSHGRPGFTISSPLPLLIHGTALRIEPTGEWHIDKARCEALLKQLADAHVDLRPMSPERHFVTGQVPVMMQCSFVTPLLRDTAAFALEVCMLPAAPDATPRLITMIMAVSARAGMTPSTLHLLGHLLSAPVQQRFGALGGNLPVRQDALTAPPDWLDRAVALNDQATYWNIDAPLTQMVYLMSIGKLSPADVVEALASLIS